MTAREQADRRELLELREAVAQANRAVDLAYERAGIERTPEARDRFFAKFRKS